MSFLSSKSAGGSRFPSRHFPKSVTLASCNFVGRPFSARYACSIVNFHSSIILSFLLLVIWSMSIGSSLTNKRKTATFDDFRLFWAFFLPFLSQFSKMTEYNRFIFSGTLVHPNIFRFRFFWAFSDAWFARKKILTELNSPISGVHFSFATIFQYLNFGRFRSYSKLKFLYRCSLQWWKLFVDVFFHLWGIRKQTLWNIKKKALFLSSESVNMLIRGEVAAVCVVRNHSKRTSIVFLWYLY